jgi:predicted DNA binding CopG/RHH family protein
MSHVHANNGDAVDAASDGKVQKGAKSVSQQSKKPIPDFTSEQEELDYWDEHDITEFDDGTADDLSLQLKATPKRPVTLRLDEDLIASLKAAAKKHGMPYQTLARELLRRGVQAYL